MKVNVRHGFKMDEVGNTLKTLAVNFSSRQDGNCGNIMKLVSRMLNDVSTVDFSQLQISPCGTCDYGCFTNRDACPHIGDSIFSLYDKICSSDSVLFIIPNYCDYPCSNFFVFNERSNCYFQQHPELLKKYLEIDKKFIVISNTNTTHFEEILSQQVSEQPRILFLSPKAFGKNSIDGNILESPEAVELVEGFIK